MASHHPRHYPYTCQTLSALSLITSLFQILFSFLTFPICTQHFFSPNMSDCLRPSRLKHAVLPAGLNNLWPLFHLPTSAYSNSSLPASGTETSCPSWADLDIHSLPRVCKPGLEASPVLSPPRPSGGSVLGSAGDSWLARTLGMQVPGQRRFARRRPGAEDNSTEGRAPVRARQGGTGTVRTWGRARNRTEPRAPRPPARKAPARRALRSPT